MRLLSWNVNGIRAVERKGFKEWFDKENFDILCIQETKARPEQLSDFLKGPEGFFAYFSSAEKKGYSGVAVYTKEEPVSVSEVDERAVHEATPSLVVPSLLILVISPTESVLTLSTERLTVSPA